MSGNYWDFPKRGWAWEVYSIGPLHDPVTWYGINYAGTQVTQWEFQNKGTRTSPARLSFVLEVPPRNLRPSVIIPYHVTGSCRELIEVIHRMEKDGDWYIYL